MATKDDYCQSFKANNQQSNFSNQNDQYKSLNLNEKRKCSSILETLQSKSFSTTSNFSSSTQKKDNYACTKASDENIVQSKNHSFSWNQKSGDIRLCETSKEWKSNDPNSKNSSNNNSTLSLHITAYENSIEAQNGLNSSSSVAEKKDATNLSKVKINKILENLKTGFASMSAFEIPRQQTTEGASEPEIMGFKASQKLAKTAPSAAPSSGPSAAPSATPSSGPTKYAYKAPQQEALSKRITDIELELDYLSKKTTVTDDDNQRRKTLKKEKQELMARLQKLKSWAKASEKKRKAERESGPLAKRSAGSGRPRIEESYPQLQEAILDALMGDSAADENRQSEALRCCKTLDDLVKLLLETKNIVVARTTLYTRLLPRNCSTIEGRRHLNTVPVKLLRPTNDQMKIHEDGHFANATINFMKNYAVLMGPALVNFISQDDKCRVPLGLPAANKQNRILMHLEYRISLPDHDFVVAERHKLIPSVYAQCLVEDKQVSSSGTTHCFIRSGKHDKSTAASHHRDLLTIFEAPTFRNENGSVKPILLVTVDGGPDENPRFPKTLAAWSSAFKVLDLDFLAVASHAPGQSAFNMVERRMAPLSRALVGLILPFDHFGSHLNSSRKTIDKELEKANFAAAGKVLAEIWSEMKINGFDVSANYVDPPCELIEEMPLPDPEWLLNHVQQSQYCLQIKKCEDLSCCKPKRAPQILQKGFLPIPVPISKTSKGFIVDRQNGHFLTITERLAINDFVPKDIVMDSYCPSLDERQLKQRTCECGYYSPSIKANSEHKKSLVCLEADISTDDEDEAEENGIAVIPQDNNADDIPVVSYDNRNSIHFMLN